MIEVIGAGCKGPAPVFVAHAGVGTEVPERRRASADSNLGGGGSMPEAPERNDKQHSAPWRSSSTATTPP